ncbi:MAG: TatD family hydrolase [candidate division Zixibacteria bacterium]|nr:TatD family hydrolase [candidate division Zixibacteria bacterium]
MIDSHCHIDFDAFDGRREEVIEQAQQAGIHTLINIGVDIQSSERSIHLAEQYDNIYATVGVHPHDAKKVDRHSINYLRELADHPKVMAIGEIGLDFYRDYSPRPDQKKAFQKQLELAAEAELPVVIHTRESFKETVEIVRDFYSDIPGGVFHCFPGSVEDAFEVIELGFVIGIGGGATHNNSSMATAAGGVPIDRIILETDSPYQKPAKYKERYNCPATIKVVCEKVAQLRGTDMAEVEKITDRTCQKLFHLVDTFGD